MAPAYKILLLLAVAIVLNACKVRKEEGEVEAPPGQWYRVMSTEGIGQSDTELFTIETGQWRVKWETLPIKEEDKGFLNLWVYSEGELFVDHPVSSYDIDYTEGEALISGAGTFYINVGSEDLSWKVIVEEYRNETLFYKVDKLSDSSL